MCPYIGLQMNSYFQNKVIWITGASSGIGKALAEACVRCGGRVIVSARREKLLIELKASLQNGPGTVNVLPLDVTVEEEIPLKVEQALSFYGRIDILINNAGTSMRSLVKDLHFDVVKKMIETNFLGPVNITLNVLKHMYKTGGGHIVVVSSPMGKFGTPLRSAYCAAKHALQGFFESLAVEGRRDSIDVTVILPGWVRTEISYRALVGNGAEQGQDDGHAIAEEPSAIAPRILRAISKKKHEYYVAMNTKTWIGLILKRLSPAVLRFALRKVKVT